MVCDRTPAHNRGDETISMRQNAEEPGQPTYPGAPPAAGEAPEPESRQAAARQHRAGRLWQAARGRRVLLLVQALYVLAFCGWLLYEHSFPDPDVVAIFLLVFALVAARGLRFLQDWTPFVLVLLAYIGLTGVTQGLVARVHYGFPIVADRAMFSGHLPTVWLQARFYHPGHMSWYDYGATLLYPLHFVVPLIVAFVFWWWLPRYYWPFVISYLLLCYAGFLTYVVYPMAPPWLAGSVGRIPPVHVIVAEVNYGGVINPVELGTRWFKTNPVAAMPSLHAGFPVLVWLVLWYVWPRWGWTSIVYPLAMSLAVVYLGEHYVIDVLVGWVYAFVAFAIVWRNQRGEPGELVLRSSDRTGTARLKQRPTGGLAARGAARTERGSPA